MPKRHERPHSYPSTIGLPTVSGQRDGQQSEMGAFRTRVETNPHPLGKKATPDTVMDIAIMADAHAVAGNRELLKPVKQHLSDLMLGQELILTEFCRPALNFSVPSLYLVM